MRRPPTPTPTPAPTSPPFLTSAVLSEAGVKHGYFTRQGGVSWGRGDLNCGLGADDDPAAVAENRDRVRRALGADRLVSLFQVHSADVVTLTKAPDWQQDRGPKADALVTNVPGLALGALSADCGALLAVDPEAGVIASAHSGWKGTAANIARAMIGAMEDLGAQRHRIRVALGPMIRQESYEVGPEFSGFFAQAVADHQRFFRPAAKAGHFMGDVAGIIAAQIQAEGVDLFEDIGGDTYAQAETFFSARRGAHRREPDYGRLISCIVLPSEAG